MNNKNMRLTTTQQQKDIDLIIGGHTYSLTNLQLQNSIGNEVLVNQVGCYGINWPY
jgi:5'-nucleotidase